MPRNRRAMTPLGWLGVGHMGLPMARNLLRAGLPLMAWSRTRENSRRLGAAGAHIADSAEVVLQDCDPIFLMLRDAHAIDGVLQRGTRGFGAALRGKTIVQLGTTAPEYSQELAFEIAAAGGAYVEAPVSGSRGPAEEGRLVGMLAGESPSIERVEPLLQFLCERVFRCGRVPSAMRMKLAANHFLIGMVTVLAEALQAARGLGLDVDQLRQILDAGPMASAVSRAKLDLLARQEYPPEAAVRDVATIAQLVLDTCESGEQNVPLIRNCAMLYRIAVEAGHGDADMAAVVRVFSLRAARPV
ncbi:MAG: NAD(P)-dependent oxidoreductase [Parvularculaceae bacterium]